jgi:histidine triad (HIT) family protein
MSDSIYTKIRSGKIPGEILYSDDLCFVILTIMPNNPGHMLLIPVEEVADWQEIEPEVFSHMMALAQKLGKITKKIYKPPKIGLSCVGFEVPHVHIHIFSLFEIGDIDHSKARSTTAEAMRVEADKIRAELKREGIVK